MTNLKSYTSEELLILSRKESNARKRIRLLAISHFLNGDSRTAIANRLSVARSSVNAWVSNLLNEGLAGLDNKGGAGRPRLLTPEQLEQLKQHLLAHTSAEKGGRLTGADIGDYIHQHFNVRFNSGHVYKIIKRLGFSWITTRSKHPKQSQASQEAFKKV